MKYDVPRPAPPHLPSAKIVHVRISMSEDAARALAEDLSRAYRDELDTRRLAAVRLDP